MSTTQYWAKDPLSGSDGLYGNKAPQTLVPMGKRTAEPEEDDDAVLLVLLLLSATTTPQKSQPAMLPGMLKCMAILWSFGFRATARTRTRTWCSEGILGTGAEGLTMRGRCDGEDFVVCTMAVCVVGDMLADDLDTLVVVETIVLEHTLLMLLLVSYKSCDH